MKGVRLRNQEAEDQYFFWLSRWRAATKDLDNNSEQDLRRLWNQLERAYRAIGYEIGDRD